MKRIIYPLLLSAFSSFSALAQEPTMFVRYIKVLDGFTQEALTEARVSIMEKDSVTLVGDSLEAWFINNKYIGHQGTVPRRNHVVIRWSVRDILPSSGSGRFQSGMRRTPMNK